MWERVIFFVIFFPLSEGKCVKFSSITLKLLDTGINAFRFRLKNRFSKKMKFYSWYNQKNESFYKRLKENFFVGVFDSLVFLKEKKNPEYCS